MHKAGRAIESSGPGVLGASLDMIESRPYRLARARDEVIEEIRRGPQAHSLPQDRGSVLRRGHAVTPISLAGLTSGRPEGEDGGDRGEGAAGEASPGHALLYSRANPLLISGRKLGRSGSNSAELRTYRPLAKLILGKPSAHSIHLHPTVAYARAANLHRGGGGFDPCLAHHIYRGFALAACDEL